VIPLLDISELLRSPQERSQRSVAEARAQAAGLRRARALVVDDSLSVRRAIASMLEDHGYEVVLARDGLEAIKSLEAVRPDVLLTDLEMPNMNGLELTAHVRSRPEFADLTIIMITSRSMDKHRRQAMSAGVNAYLNKPYSEHELLQHVANAVTARVEKRVAAG
jgi:chemosensory pili system protein ChpA (sensor histidine kinase/response regulator)